jgi:hypothetical protein
MGLEGKIESSNDDSTGNMLQRIQGLKGKLPDNELGIELPEWLRDEQAHCQACEAEIGIYEHILLRLEKLSSGREQRKADLLLELSIRHEQVIAFDHFPLTLRYLQHLMLKQASTAGVEVLLGVGGNKSANEKLQKRLNPETGSGRLIALCSDALSEGVNLQRASTMVHLDMPSVVRYAEQRVGRIDRMDSPHDQIECWWPQDASAFALKADERFVARVEEVDSLIGGNLQLPTEMVKTVTPEVIVTGEDLEREMRERETQSWDGIEDAFAPVRSLLEGSYPLVDAEEYQRFRTEEATVFSRVSLVRSDKPWLFICLAGSDLTAPRWVLLPAIEAKPLTNLREVVNALRERLTEQVESLKPSHSAGRELERFLNKLSEVEQSLLPKRKQRALEQMRIVLGKWSSNRSWVNSSDQADQVKTLLNLMSGAASAECPDWAQLADCWLDLVRPTWSAYLDKRGKKAGITRLRDIQKDLLDKPIAVEKVLERVAGINLRQKWEERIVACIFGFGG